MRRPDSCPFDSPPPSDWPTDLDSSVCNQSSSSLALMFTASRNSSLTCSSLFATAFASSCSDRPTPGTRAAPLGQHQLLLQLAAGAGEHAQPATVLRLKS